MRTSEIFILLRLEWLIYSFKAGVAQPLVVVHTEDDAAFENSTQGKRPWSQRKLSCSAWRFRHRVSCTRVETLSQSIAELSSCAHPIMCTQVDGGCTGAEELPAPPTIQRVGEKPVVSGQFHHGASCLPQAKPPNGTRLRLESACLLASVRGHGCFTPCRGLASLTFSLGLSISHASLHRLQAMEAAGVEGRGC